MKKETEKAGTLEGLEVGKVPVERLGDIAGDVLCAFLSTFEMWPIMQKDGTLKLIPYDCNHCQLALSKTGYSSSPPWPPAVCQGHHGSPGCLQAFDPYVEKVKRHILVDLKRLMDYVMNEHAKSPIIDNPDTLKKGSVTFSSGEALFSRPGGISVK